MRKLNNKGFTLVELLAVVVILVVIMTIALPNISSSIERNKKKQNEALEKVIISAAELYVSDNRNSLVVDDPGFMGCYLSIENDLFSYLGSDDLGDYKNGCVYVNASGDVDDVSSSYNSGYCGNNQVSSKCVVEN